MILLFIFLNDAYSHIIPFFITKVEVQKNLFFKV